MNQNESLDNAVISIGTLYESALLSRCPMSERCRPICHATTAGMKWNKANIVVIDCLYRNQFFDESRKPVRGQRKNFSENVMKRNLLFETMSQ